MQNRTALVLFIAALVLAVIAYIQGGTASVIEGIKNGLGVLYSVFLLLLAAFMLAGLVQVLVPQELIGKLLGSESGIKGYIIAGLAGALIPGGPYVYFPLAASFIASGAALGPMVSFIVAKNLWSLSRIPMEIALVTPRITLIRFISTLLFPPLAGLIAHTLFGRVYYRIRQDVKCRQGGSEG